MKTSNKLLIEFLIIVLAVPLCFLLTMKTKVKKAEFTMDNKHPIVTGKLGGYKVIKIEGISNAIIADVLSCRLRPSSRNEYEYTDFNDENGYLTVNKQGDTILIRYNRAQNNTSYSYNNLEINLYVPDMKNIVVSNATAIIDSMDFKFQKMISVKLQNRAALYVGADLQGINRYLVKVNKDGSYTPLPKIVSTTQTFDSLNIVGVADSKVVLGEVHIKNLILNMQGYSSLEIPYRFNVDNISGKISAEATVKANRKGIEALQPLLK